MIMDKLKADLAETTSGYVAVIDGVVNPFTFNSNRNQSARAALIIKSGKYVLSTCTDDHCDCMVQVLAENYPDAKIVAADVKVRKE